MAEDSKSTNELEALAKFESEKQEIHALLEEAVKRGASDLHLVVGASPILRIQGELVELKDRPVLTPGYAERLVGLLMNDDQKKFFISNKELDFSYPYRDKAYFRVNIFRQKGKAGAVLRLIPSKVLTIDELGLPPVIHKFAQAKRGLVLVTGPTGHGKSSTLAAIIDEINETRSEHIITIEDPIEFVYEHKRSIINQRELYNDTLSFGSALRSVLREDPDVILIGEMRDAETMEAALTIAETGHLVFGTVHSNTAAETADRIIYSFEAYQQPQIRTQLAAVLLGVINQRLIPKVGGGRVPLVEILIATPSVRSLIREGKTYQLPNAIQTGVSEGMISIEKALSDLLSKGLITPETVKQLKTEF